MENWTIWENTMNWMECFTKQLFLKFLIITKMPTTPKPTHTRPFSDTYFLPYNFPHSNFARSVFASSNRNFRYLRLSLLQGFAITKYRMMWYVYTAKAKIIMASIGIMKNLPKGELIVWPRSFWLQNDPVQPFWENGFLKSRFWVIFGSTQTLSYYFSRYTNLSQIQ